MKRFLSLGLSAALCALLLLWQAWLPSIAGAVRPPQQSNTRSAPPSGGKHLTAIFIVAPADLPDPNFGGSTVLVMNDLGPAPVGIIINRPTRLPVSAD